MRAPIRFLLDAFFIACFFVVTLALAAGADRLVEYLTALHTDPFVVGAVHWLARGLVVMDVIGVAIAGVVSLIRFVGALVRDASDDGKEGDEE